MVGNNHYRGKALVTVLSLANRLEGRQAVLPPQLIEEYPAIKSFARAGEPIAAAPREPKKARRKKSSPSPRDDGQMMLFD